jgi:predicted metal-binding membrane protein
MKTALSGDDLTEIQLPARDAISAGEQASEARGLGAHREADALETERRMSIAQICKVLGSSRPVIGRAGELSRQRLAGHFFAALASLVTGVSGVWYAFALAVSGDRALVFFICGALGANGR